MNYLHILVDVPSNYNNLITENLFGVNPILSWNPYHLVHILKNLPPEQKVCIWFHVRQYSNGILVTDTEKLAGISWAKQFKTDHSLKNMNIYYTTSGTIDNNIKRACENKLFGYENMNNAVEEGLKGNTFEDNKIVTLQTVAEILGLNQHEGSVDENIQVSLPETNNWRTNYIKFFVNHNKLQKIISKCFKNISYESGYGFKVYVLEPGLSGAYVLRVEYKDEGNIKNRILKIHKKGTLIPQEKIAASIYRQKIEASSDVFISFESEQSQTVDEFDCCIYSAVQDATTLGHYLRTNIDILDINRLTEIIDTIFNRYKKRPNGKLLYWGVKSVNSKPWGGSSIEHNGNSALTYQGLKMKPEFNQFSKVNICELMMQYSDNYLIDLFDLQTKESLDQLVKEIFEFLDNGKWKYQIIDGNDDTTVPISSVHGDFNCGNILVDQDTGLNPRFIDLSQISPNMHAMYDIGKLSVEMEKKVLADGSINDSKVYLKDWILIHKKWLNEEHTTDEFIQKPKFETLNKVYNLIDVIKKQATSGWEQHNITNFSLKEAKRQFYFVRIHYLLRFINQKQLIPAKKLFALVAVVDTLNYIADNQKNK